MKMNGRNGPISAIVSCSALIASCASPDVLPRGAEAYDLIPAPTASTAVQAYRLGPLDVISVTVFQEPELSLPSVQVNAAGAVSIPLIGEVPAVGKTPDELARDVAIALGRTYLVDPQVSVAVTNSVSQKVTVEGNVVQPGVYDIQGQTTLLKALALARSPTRVAANDEVVIFRMIGGQRTGALFNVDAIRRGQAPDPQVLGNDVVVVGFSTLKGAYRDFISIAPALGVFVRY